MTSRSVHHKALFLALVLCSFILTIAPVALAGNAPLPFADYRTESWFLPQSPSVAASPAAAIFNPAAWHMRKQSGMDLWWNDQDIRNGLDNLGISLGHTLGFAAQTRTFGTPEQSYRTYDYQIGFSHGNQNTSYGMAYRWSNGDTDIVGRQQTFSVGMISRQRSWLTFGAAGTISLESKAAQSVFDLGIRPFSKPWLTLYADWTANNDQRFLQDGTWGAGLEIRPISGLHLGIRAREMPNTGDVDYSAVVGVTLNDFNVNALPHYNKDGDRLQTSYLARITPAFAGLPIKQPLLFREPAGYFPLSLENRYLTYQRYQYLDNKRIAWLDLLPVLNALRDDDRLEGIVVNLSGFQARPSLIWELRQKLAEISESGKEVVIHGDRMDAKIYWLASVADRVTCDPMGIVAVPGFALNRTYLKGLLDKLKLGFQPFQYFKYKTAVESLSRTDMSAGDKEQRQRIVDVLYETMRSDIVSSRSLTSDHFDKLVDDKAVLTPKEAMEMGLIDEITRWDKIPKWLSSQRNARLSGAQWIRFNNHYWDAQWGAPVKIPVVYAIGTCAMDSGIKGRSTSQYLLSLINDPEVAAVVLRADSPGGDPLPSDLVADAIRQLTEAGKPVIISQGDVAASGGYWISMDGTEIMTTPVTITGSVGVIGGWLWDDGFAENLGISSTTLSRGKHADLAAKVSIPLLGSIPYRALDDVEETRVKQVILDYYQGFIEAVGKGRDMSPEDVHKIAQGRVWMGGDAIDNGLCDSFGTLDDAINMARAKANIADWREVQLVEYPPRPLIEMPSFGPKLAGPFGLLGKFSAFVSKYANSTTTSATVDLGLLPIDEALTYGLSAMDLEYLKAIISANGQPVLMVAPDILPEGWNDID